jgi:hypothetical protein
MRTFSFFSNTFLIIACYPNSCKLVVLGSFRFYKKKKGNDATSIAPPFDYMEIAYDCKRVCS